jgi:hypothetical protein
MDRVGFSVPSNKGARWHDVLDCGTAAAARRHYRRKELIDESCRQAETRRMQDYRERRRNAGGPLGGRWPSARAEQDRETDAL